MNNLKLLIASFTLLCMTNTHAGWGDISKERKAAIGIGVAGAALSANEDRKAKDNAIKALDLLTYESVYNDQDCREKYKEVLSSEQIKSNSSWVGDITAQIDDQCAAAIPENAARRQQEIAAEEKLEAQQRAIREKQRELHEYERYRAQFSDIKSMATAYAIERWQELYDGQYQHMINSSRDLPANRLKEISHEFAECLQVNMAISNPNAPDAVINKLSTYFDADKKPVDYYEEIFFESRKQCTHPELRHNS